jgi:hypothetical protein
MNYYAIVNTEFCPISANYSHTTTLQVRSLFAQAPKEEEITTLKDFDGDKDKLGKVVTYFIRFIYHHNSHYVSSIMSGLSVNGLLTLTSLRRATVNNGYHHLVTAVLYAL